MADTQFQGQFSGMHRTRSAERQQREIAWIEAALDGDHANRPLHISINHPNHSARSVRGIRFHGMSELFDGTGCALRVQTHAAAKKIPGEQPPSYQIRVGHSRQLTTSITCRSWIGTRALRANLQRATGIDGGKGAATCTHSMNIDNWGSYGITAGITKCANPSASLEQ